MRTKIRAFIVEITTLIFIVIFVYAALNKLLERSLFAAQMRKAHLLEAISEPLSYIVPILEIILAFLLISAKSKFRAMLGSTILMFAFTIYIILILALNKETPCGCGGIIQSLSWPAHIVLNAILTTIGFIACRIIRKTNPARTNHSY